MTTANSAAIGSAAPSAWAWPLNVNRFRRRDRLSQDESDAPQGLGFDLRRLDRDRDHLGWQAILRLTAPLDETLAVLHWHPDTVFQRRFARYATAIVLHHCGQLGRDFWWWSTREWADLLRPQQLRQRFAGQVGMQARPYLLAYACLLAGFTAFDLVGPFARHTVAQRVFGADLVEEAIEPVRAVLAGWGYRAANLESMIYALLLLNRSPMLTDLTSPVLERLRTGWPAPGATSTSPSSPAKVNSCKRNRTSSACPSASRSPATNKPPSKTVKQPSTTYCNASPTSRLRPGPHHDNSPPPPRCQSSPSTTADQHELDNPDSTERPSGPRSSASTWCHEPRSDR